MESAAESDLELVRRFYALSGVDLVPLLSAEGGEAAVKSTLAHFLHPEFEFDYEGGKGALAEFSGTFRGPDALIEGWREWLRPWATYFIELEELERLDEERILALIRVRARLRDGGDEMTFPVGAIWTMRDGKARRISQYQDRDKLRKDAGPVTRS